MSSSGRGRGALRSGTVYGIGPQVDSNFENSEEENIGFSFDNRNPPVNPELSSEFERARNGLVEIQRSREEGVHPPLAPNFEQQPQNPHVDTLLNQLQQQNQALSSFTRALEAINTRLNNIELNQPNRPGLAQNFGPPLASSSNTYVNRINQLEFSDARDPRIVNEQPSPREPPPNHESAPHNRNRNDRHPFSAPPQQPNQTYPSNSNPYNFQHHNPYYFNVKKWDITFDGSNVHEFLFQLEDRKFSSNIPWEYIVANFQLPTNFRKFYLGRN
ncbi:hypothetical protein ACFFRR_009821 [Megaselia abdita]